MSTLGTSDRPLRVAIVGSGPSGFYAAEALLKSDTVCTVDVFDRLLTPFGLVRNGVAPDHPKIRNATKVYDRIAEDPNFSFFGNVTIGKDIPVETLKRHYDALVFAYGTESDKRMWISGEELKGSHPATKFVGWYNGHPDYCDLSFDLTQETAVVVGVGNVAMDVTRLLAKTPEELRKSEIAQHALEALSESKIKDIYLVARRGPAQVKFTLPELKELQQLEDCDLIIDRESLVLDPVSEQEKSNKNVARLMQQMEEQANKPVEGKSRRIHLHFLESPLELKGTDRLESVVMEKNRLEGDEPFNLKARGTGETVELPCGLLFRSIGYNGKPIPGVPFDERKGIIPNVGGRVTEAQGGAVVAGLYCVGWIKRGPTGVIGTNKPCSVETAGLLLKDVPSLKPCEEPDTTPILSELMGKGIRVVTFADWAIINAAELAAGKSSGKPRERFTSRDEMLALLDPDEINQDRESLTLQTN